MLVHATIPDLADLQNDEPYVVLLEDQRSKLCVEFRNKLLLNTHKISNYCDHVYVLQVSAETIRDPLFSTVRVPQLRVIRNGELLAKFTGIRDIESAFLFIKELGLS